MRAPMNTTDSHTASRSISGAPFRLIYSVRTPKDRIYADELARRAAHDSGLDVAFVHTRTAPDDETRAVGRICIDDLGSCGWPAELAPTCYICGPAGFLETVSDFLRSRLGQDPY